MSLSDIPWIVYVVGCLLLYRFAVRAFRQEMVDEFPNSPWDWSDVVACMFFGACATALWPVWIVPVAVARLTRRRFRTPEDFLLFVGGQSKAERLKRQADRIAELERELNIR